MRPRTRLLAATALAALAVAGWVGLEFRFTYRWPGFPSARSPSLVLELQQRVCGRAFHAQFGQDKWILGVVFPGVTDGYFVDVGAWHARHDSNTKALEDAGWTGVCIEPFPAGDWSERKARLFREVVYREAGVELEFRLAGPLGGIDQHLGMWRDQVDGHATVKLRSTTLAAILEAAAAPRFIHYLSIDTEGSEYEVLLGFPFDTHEVGALTVEHNGEEDKRARVRALLEARGYRFVKQQVVEDWFVRDA